jgi:hypothetical protein
VVNIACRVSFAFPPYNLHVRKNVPAKGGAWISAKNHGFRTIAASVAAAAVLSWLVEGVCRSPLRNQFTLAAIVQRRS